MLLFIYLVLTAIVAFSAGANYAVLPAVGFAACSLFAFFMGYQPAATLLHVKEKKLLYLAVQAATIALLLWLASLTEVRASLFDVKFSAPVWVGIGLAVGALNGFTTPPSPEELAQVEDDAASLGRPSE